MGELSEGQFELFGNEVPNMRWVFPGAFIALILLGLIPVIGVIAVMLFTILSYLVIAGITGKYNGNVATVILCLIFIPPVGAYLFYSMAKTATT